MHAAAYEWVAKAVDEYGPFRSVFEFGARNVNGSVRSLFVPPANYVGVDIEDGPGVDVVADAASFTGQWSVSAVVCCEVFEHTEDWRAICEAAARNLNTGGVFIVTAAGPGRSPHSATDGGALRPDEFYANINAPDLGAELSLWFSDVVVDDTGQDVRAVAVKGVG